MTAAMEVEGQREGYDIATGVIDTDIHEQLPSAYDLLPYLPPQWHRYITDFGWKETMVATGPYVVPTPGGTFRKDAYPANGAKAGSDLGLLRAQLLDHYNITVGILNGSFHVSSMKAWFEFATALASAYNDWQIATWLEKDPRLRGSVHLVAHDPVAAVREIERVGTHPQIVQVFLPVSSDVQWGDPYFRPIFEAAVRNHLVVAMHNGPETRPAVGYPRYYIEWHTTMNQAHMCQIVSLICNGVFDQFPDLKVVVLEGGFSWLPHLMWRLDQQYREVRSEVPWVKRMPSTYIRDNIRLSTQPIEQIEARHFLQLIDMMGSDRLLMYSSDYPHWDFDAPDRALPAGIPEDLRRKILFENARETYDLDLPA